VTAVEEIRDVGVLLGLCDVELAHSTHRQNLGHGLADVLLGEGDGTVEVVPVAPHRREVEAQREESFRELPSSIRPEVEEDQGVAILHPMRCRLSDHGRLDELVGHSARVARLDGGDGIRGHQPFSPTDRRDGALCALEPPVSIHGVVTAADGDDAGTLRDELPEVVGRRGRRDVTAVGERVDEGVLRHLLAPAQLEEGAQVVDVGVDAPVGDEAEQMDGSTLAPCSPERAP
jgi:hypothetical protein